MVIRERYGRDYSDGRANELELAPHGPLVFVLRAVEALPYGILRFCERRFQAVEHGCGCPLRLVLPTGGWQCGAACALSPGFAVATRGLASPVSIYLGNAHGKI